MKRLLVLFAILLSALPAYAQPPSYNIGVSSMPTVDVYLAEIINRYRARTKAGKAIPRNYTSQLNNCRIKLIEESLSGEITCPRVKKVEVTFTLTSRKPKTVASIGFNTFGIRPLKRTTTGGTFNFQLEDKFTRMTIRIHVKKYR